MEKIISSVKHRFAEEGWALKKYIPSLEAVFCIGSSANNQNFKNKEYQDFDIHFYVNKSFLNKKDLDAIKEIFRKIAESLENKDTAIDYCIKDKPWKMVPRKKINIGFHGTLLNRLDYMKRICPNHILASNMFNNSETLSGRLTYQERSIPGHDFLYRAGGIGWLKENFYRLLNVFDPANETTSASIKEVAIYFGLTPLIHYYYLRNGMTANRQKSYNFFMNEGSVSKKVKDAVEFIYNFKNGDKECHQQDNLPLLEATYIVLNFVGKSFAETGAKATEKQQNTIEDEDSALISTLIGRQASIASVKSYFSANTFVEALTMIKTNAAAFSNVTPDEYFETLAFLIKNPDVNEVKRVYFFEQGDLRANDNIDFLPKSFSSLVYSWEKGIATYVQRLTELYLNSSNLTENDLMLAKVLVSVSFKKYLELRNEGLSLEYLDSKLGFTNGFSLEDRYFHCLELLADLGESAINEINSKI